MTVNARRSDWSRGASRPELGVELKRMLRDPGSWSATVGAQAECLPYEDNYVELADSTDPWGIPVLRIHAYWHENEMRMREDMKARVAEVLEAAGCRDVRTSDGLAAGNPDSPPGAANHEMGTARMGRDSRTSVLNAHNQGWDAPNVYVTDG